MLGAQRGALGNRHVLVGEHRQHAVADQFQHFAAGVMDGVDRGLRIIIEERDDLAGLHPLADRGRGAQVGEPQHRLDLLGDAARHLSTQHLFGRLAPEIDPPQRPRDIGLRRRLDRKPQHRHEVAQRRQALLAKALVPPRRPVGIDAIHLAHRAGLAEAVHEGGHVLVALGREFVEARIAQRGRCRTDRPRGARGRFRACRRRSSAARLRRLRPRRSSRTQRCRAGWSRCRASESRGPRRSDAACR